MQKELFVFLPLETFMFFIVNPRYNVKDSLYRRNYAIVQTWRLSLTMGCVHVYT